MSKENKKRKRKRKNPHTPMELVFLGEYLHGVREKKNLSQAAEFYGVSREKMKYRLDVLADDTGDLYKLLDDEDTVEFTEWGIKLDDYLETILPLVKKFAPIHTQRVIETLHTGEGHPSFPHHAKLFNEKDPYPDIPSDQKLCIQCTSCMIEVMAKRNKTTEQWLQKHKNDLEGPSPKFLIKNL